MHCFVIPIAVQPPQTNAECSVGLDEAALHHPTAPASARPLPFLWTLALLRFLSRTSTRLDRNDSGVVLWHYSLYTLCDGTVGSLWKVSLSENARKLLDFLLVGTKYTVFVREGAANAPFSAGKGTGPVRQTTSLAHNKKSIENIVLDEFENTIGTKVPRGAKRNMFRQLERVDAAMLMWATLAAKHGANGANGTTEGGCKTASVLYTTLQQLGLMQIKSDAFPDIRSATELCWKQRVASLAAHAESDTASECESVTTVGSSLSSLSSLLSPPSPPSSPSSPSAVEEALPPPRPPPPPRQASPLPDRRIREPMEPGPIDESPQERQLVDWEEGGDAASEPPSDPPSPSPSPRRPVRNEMLVSYLLSRPVDGVRFTSVASRLEWERSVWGCSRSLLI